MGENRRYKLGEIFAERRRSLRQRFGVRPAWAALAIGSSGLVATAALVIFGLQLWLIVHHAIWFDEAQALLIARAPIGELWTNLHYEGHPALWYLVLAVLDQVTGGQPQTLVAAQVLVASCTTGLIWFRSPFPTWTKFLIVLSYYLIFEYGVIARSYGLGALLLLAAVAYRSSWVGWACLALAANTAIHFAMGAVALGGVMFMERRSWQGAAILLLGLIVAAATIFPHPADLRLAVPNDGSAAGHALIAVHKLSAVFVPLDPKAPLMWARLMSAPQSLFVAAAALPLGLVGLRGRWSRLGYVAVLLGLIALCVTVYNIYTRHVGVLFVYLLAALWIEIEAVPDRRPSSAVGVWLVCLAVCGVIQAGGALFIPFTPQRLVAKWIVAHHLQNEAWGSWPGKTGTVQAALLSRPFINIQKGCTQTFTRWNYDLNDFSDAPGRIARSGVHYLMSEEIMPWLSPVTVFPGGMGPVRVYIYELPDPHSVAPTCDR